MTDRSKELTQPEIDRLLQAVDLGLNFLRSHTLTLEAARSAVLELQRFRISAKGGGRPLVFAELLEELAKDNELLAIKLGECELRKFDLGRLSLRTTSGETFCYISFMRTKIEQVAEQLYGCSFKLQLRHVDAEGSQVR